ncbi:site-specific DNA-methyltransferase [Campylobacter upsaliensis]|nr:site-specific DNA-methyltransferase [Campylobacter upsaliensis]MEB2817897.1 site-specific DNA-methyltransferase [Campylobacter upsaliensis]
MNTIFYKSSQNMSEVSDCSVDLIITSPPYFNIKDYAKNGYQDLIHSHSKKGDLGAISEYKIYIQELLKVWRECERVLKPNGKLCINVPLMPMFKKDLRTHYNRHIFDLQSDIQHSILESTALFLLDLYIWNRTNTTKKLMFGSYPYPRNFYAQNTSEFITIYVKDGKPQNTPQELKEQSKLTQKEWVEYTKQIWDIPIPNKSDVAFGKHAAIMPEAIPYRLIKLYSFIGDIVLDPFAGSGTTLKVAKELGRNFIGYEIYPHYKSVIEEKLRQCGLFATQGQENAK